MPKPLSILVVLALVCGAARAGADGDGGRVEAKRLRDLGAQAVDRGAFDEALTAFQRAAELYASPNLRFNIGVALDGLGRYDEAVAAFEAFLDASATPDDARDYAIARIRELEPRIARLALTVTPPHATVRIDGRPMRLTPGRELPLMPGTRAVTAALEDFATERRVVTLTAGRRTELTLSLVPARGLTAPPPDAPPAASLPARAPAPSHRALRDAAIGVGAGAAAALVLAAVFTARTVEITDEINHPRLGQAYDPALRASGRTSEAVEQAFYVVGGAAVVTSVVLGVLAARHDRPPRLAPSRLAAGRSGLALTF